MARMRAAVQCSASRLWHMRCESGLAVQNSEGPSVKQQPQPSLQTVLHDTFGFAALRPGQDEVIAAVLAGADVLAVMPTGSGKSLCYQLPAVVEGGLTLVVSPLIALMRDQVAAMRALGVAAASLSSANSHEDNMAALDEAKAGKLRLLYAAPERLASPGLQHGLPRSGWRGWRSTRRIASRNGGTTSGPTICSSARCGNSSAPLPCWR
jgi:superfamily II DNA helicase RecQ